MTFTSAQPSSEDTNLELLCRFEVAPASLVEARSLQQRVDTKFVMPMASLAPLLERLSANYFLLLAGERGWARYESVYFDTAARDLFHAHRRGIRPRYKVRIRHHVDRHLTFLEVKQKHRSGRTTKERLALPFLQTTIGAREREFIARHTPLDAATLLPCVTIGFRRLTLAGASIPERLTFDCELTFGADGRVEHVPRMVIAEVKRSRTDHHAGAAAGLRMVRAREAALSKYCLATVRLFPVPANVFKPALRAMERCSG